MRAAAIQLNSTEDAERNRATAERLTREAVRRGAELVVLPEKWNRIGDPERVLAAAEPLDGPTIRWAQGLARELAVDLVAGSIVESAPGEERGYNTSVHVGPAGDVLAVYRKLHLFDVEVGGVVYRESATEQPGGDVVVSDLRGGERLGMSVCYDVRFPELFRILALRGATVLAVPAAFTAVTTRDHWEVVLRARALENQCFVVAANQVGAHPGGNESGGDSMIVDPWGAVLARASGDEEQAVVAELDLARRDEVRERLPLLAHRRPDAYAWPQEAPA